MTSPDAAGISTLFLRWRVADGDHRPRAGGEAAAGRSALAPGRAPGMGAPAGAAAGPRADPGAWASLPPRRGAAAGRRADRLLLPPRRALAGRGGLPAPGRLRQCPLAGRRHRSLVAPGRSLCAPLLTEEAQRVAGEDALLVLRRQAQRAQR